MEALGMVELNSIAIGVEAADAILKAANVRVVKVQPVCPGKYVVVVNGSVADVKASIEAGAEVGGMHVVDQMVIPRVHPDVISAMSGCVDLKGVEALGVIETFSLAQALLSADQAVKSAEVALMEIRLATGLGGKSFVLLTGTVSAVRAAAAAASEARGGEDMLAGTAVIPAPHEDLASALL